MPADRTPARRSLRSKSVSLPPLNSSPDSISSRTRRAAKTPSTSRSSTLSPSTSLSKSRTQGTHGKLTKTPSPLKSLSSNSTSTKATPSTILQNLALNTPSQLKSSNSNVSPLKENNSIQSFDKSPSKPTPLSLHPNNKSNSLSKGILKAPATYIQEAKSLLRRSAVPTRIVGREKERAVITKFWENHVLKNMSGSIYISGTPGTGKTALLREICEEMRQSLKTLSHETEIININCMTFQDPKQVYPHILAAVEQQQVKSFSVKESIPYLENLFVPNIGTNARQNAKPKGRREKLFVLILDEIDQLLTRDQEVLYKLFEWLYMNGSRLVLIGIANALDLMERWLPRLKGKGCDPELLNFCPYKVPEIIEIIKDRLQSVSSSNENENMECQRDPKRGSATIIQENAIALCARKIASTSGDLRKALDVCRQAIEMAERESKTSSNSSSLPSNVTVTISHIIKVLNNSAGSPILQKIRALNVHSKLIMVAAVLAVMEINKFNSNGTDTGAKLGFGTVGNGNVGRNGASKVKMELTLGKLQDTYNTLCTHRLISFPSVSRSEFIDLISRLETCSLITLHSSNAKSKLKGEERSKKVVLLVGVEDIVRGVTSCAIQTGENNGGNGGGAVEGMVRGVLESVGVKC